MQRDTAHYNFFQGTESAYLENNSNKNIQAFIVVISALLAYNSSTLCFFISNIEKEPLVHL